MIAIIPEQIINLLSVISLVASSFILYYVLLKYYRGMKTPPFWLYAFTAFLFIAFASILENVVLNIDSLVLKILRLAGYLLFLVAAIKLFKIYNARIKFDVNPKIDKL